MPLVPCATAKIFSLRTTTIRTRFFAHLVSQFVPTPSSETRMKSLDFSSPRVANTRLHPSSRSRRRRRRRRSRSFSTVVIVVMVVQTLVSEPFRSRFARVSRFPLILSNLVEKEGRVHPRAIERSFLAPPPSLSSSESSSSSSLLRHRSKTHPPLTCVCVCVCVLLEYVRRSENSPIIFLIFSSRACVIFLGGVGIFIQRRAVNPNRHFLEESVPSVSPSVSQKSVVKSHNKKEFSKITTTGTKNSLDSLGSQRRAPRRPTPSLA